MSGSSASVWQPSTGTVYRATLDALAEYGPRRVGVTHIARRARCNRSYLYRHWSSTQALIRDATLAELRHVLDVARDVPGPLPPSHCLAPRVVVRAARLVREHPVVRTMAVTDPELTHAAVLRPTTVWHTAAWSWLCRHVTAHLPLGAAQDVATLAVLTTALPYALTPPPDSPDRSGPAAERASIDDRLGASLHLCLGLSAACPDCRSEDVR
ncbi:TetR/AcrR family transcriptional regulator [Streptomyces spongiae]|uniref:Helix-turn-helix transcriptional regulator n=1 Tax=Streptomyces spongiae TaxID=565072 RepID=A0A5N8XTK4_9ACTN|nr:TetR/AcrR family transcriptional regulator [Streptomyces spongiae]MPY62378.1 helix-turn-helix transcriptional regulator [Streptomyces spongiae]